jgi:hypothetical protein
MVGINPVFRILPTAIWRVEQAPEVKLWPRPIAGTRGTPQTFEVPPIQHPLEVNLGDKVKLLGYDLDATELKAGGTLP